MAQPFLSATKMVGKRISLALIQLKVGDDKADNVRRAINLVKEATGKGSKLVALPECFNSPYGTKFFSTYAEEVPGGETCQALSAAAKENLVSRK